MCQGPEPSVQQQTGQGHEREWERRGSSLLAACLQEPPRLWEVIPLLTANPV